MGLWQAIIDGHVKFQFICLKVNVVGLQLVRWRIPAEAANSVPQQQLCCRLRLTACWR